MSLPTSIAPRRLRGAGLALIALLAACASAPADEAASEPDAKEAPDAADDAEAAEKAAKIELAELQLKKARVESTKSVGAAEVALEVAERKLEEARKKLAVFQETTKAVKLDEARLALDRSIGRAEDAAAELGELEAMYAQEEFAGATKELVLSRGRRNLEHSKRAVTIGETKLASLTDAELPAEEAGLVRGVLEAEGALESARLALEIARLGGEASIKKAEQALTKAKKEDEEEDAS